MADLTLQLLGGYQGRLRDGRELTLPTKKGWALLSYLALHPDQQVRREKLAALLWGERFEEQARGSLRQTLYEVRTALGDALADRFAATRTTVSLSNIGISVDAQRFEELANSGAADDLIEAEALYKGSLLEGLETGEEVFAEWLGGIRAHYQALACRTLEALSSLQAEAGEHERAIATAQRLVGIEPLSEQAHRLLMRALTAAGRRNEALKYYQELEKLLQAELGVKPDADTQELRGNLLAGPADGATVSDNDQAGELLPDPTTAPSRIAARGSWWARRRPRAVAAAILMALGVALAVWQPWTPTIKPASLQDMAYPLPDKPSIAVLPFENYSDDPKLDHFVRGLTEDLTAALSKAPGLFVIARNSAATYQGKAVRVKQVAEELGVQYLLEGSVQKADERLRITVQLIDALSGKHLWADRFDRPASDVFALQDEVVKRVFVELQVELTVGDRARVAGRGTKNLKAWLLRNEAIGEFLKFTREGNARALELYKAAHQADPDWVRPIAGIGFVHWIEAKRGWSADRDASIRLGIEFAERAVEVDPNEPVGYMLLGNLYFLLDEFERGLEFRRKAVELAPNDYSTVGGLATRLKDIGRAEEAIELFERAMRLGPKYPWWMPFGYGIALHMAGRKEDAIDAYKNAIAIDPKKAIFYARLAAVYVDLKRMDEAKVAVGEVLRLDPSFTVTKYEKGWKLQHPERNAWYRGLLLRAGLPK